MKTGTAYCYVTDGKNDPFMRRLSMASLRRHCGDVPVFTCTAKRLYAPTDGKEEIVDLGELWDSIYGAEWNPARKSKASSFPMIVFCKLLLPFAPHLACFEQIVFLDDDVEVLSSKFADMPQLENDADLGMVPDTVTNMPGYRAYIERAPAPVSSLWPGGTYHTAAVLLFRTDWTQSQVNRTIQGFKASQTLGFRYPEEFAANLFLRVQSLPLGYAMIPKCPAARRPGRSSEEMSKAFAAHYAGPRKKVMLEEWAKRYPEVAR